MKKITIELTDEVLKDWDIFLCQKDEEEASLMSRDKNFFFWDYIKNVFPTYTSVESQRLISAYAKKYRLPLRGCILKAHGVSDNTDWTYYDEYTKEDKFVSSFLEENDGKYSVIILCVCNEGRVLLRTGRSCIIFGDGQVGSKHVHKHGENMFRAFPSFEQVTSYTFEYDTQQLLC